MRPLAFLALCLGVASCSRPASVSSDPVAPPDAGSARGAAQSPGPTSCEQLTSLELPHAAITMARAVPASTASASAPGLARWCRVEGTSRPTPDSEIRFVIGVPSGDAWNGRYLQVGSGGFAGSLPDDDELREGLAAGFAVAGTDDGHESPSPTDARWALGHPEKVIDFGYRALKETTEAARAVIRAHTGRAPSHSYFEGCSDGGREAMIEAQRYPEDFDGVVAGAPANHWTRLFEGAAWDVRALLATPASYVPPGKLKALEDAALAACGDEDRVIEDPLSCRFDPAVLLCKGRDDDRCLTAAQLEAVRAIYAGPRNPRTREMLMPGFEPGSEAEEGGWQSWIVGRAPGAEGGAALYEFATNFFRYVVFADPTYDIRRLDFDADVASTDAKQGPVFNAYDTDLGAFRKRGGKLIQYHGWGDAAIPPRDSIGYYEAVRAKMGDPGGFYRLFMAPGMLHCDGGTGPNVLATLPAIVDWVEGGKAPERLVAQKLAGNKAGGQVERSRPLCPYPLVAAWDGKGDRKLAESFGCAASARARARAR